MKNDSTKVKVAKRDESNFRFQLQEMRKWKGPFFQVRGSKVLDAPKPRMKNVPAGYGVAKMEICFHGKLTKYFCALCEFEAPRLT